jgi:pimeloyl-ACP methyl ester carboxylesterase
MRWNGPASRPDSTRGCGHTPNIEEPTIFTLAVDAFLSAVDSGRWAGWTR